MPKDSKIGWTTHTWNPVSGCSEVSPGCDNCYARALTERFGRSFDVTLKPHKLDDVRRWEPGLIFVNSMSDLFHEEIPARFFIQVWTVMFQQNQHVYQVLTKRAARMVSVLRHHQLVAPKHIWLGVSVENQEYADRRIPRLLQAPARVRFLSCEPLLGRINLRPYLKAQGINWVITGGESGPNRRPADPDWFREIRDDCEEFGVAYFHKQGNHFRPGQDRELDGRTWDDYPDIHHSVIARLRAEETQ